MIRRKLVPPEGARLTKADGSTIPIELVYQGKEKRIHVWQAVIAVQYENGDSFSIDVVPPRTSVVLAFRI